MHVQANHPQNNLETNGRGRRYVLNTSAIRQIRLDSQSDEALLQAAKMLSHPVDIKDSVSTSMIVRQAVREYYNRLRQVRTASDLERECRLVRMNSQRPGPRRRAKATPRPIQEGAPLPFQERAATGSLTAAEPVL